MVNVPFTDASIFSPTLLAVSLLSAFTPFMMFLRVVSSQSTEDGHCFLHFSCLDISLFCSPE